MFVCPPLPKENFAKCYREFQVSGKGTNGRAAETARRLCDRVGLAVAWNLWERRRGQKVSLLPCIPRLDAGTLSCRWLLSGLGNAHEVSEFLIHFFLAADRPPDFRAKQFTEFASQPTGSHTHSPLIHPQPACHIGVSNSAL